jgi:hypothetical protein
LRAAQEPLRNSIKLPKTQLRDAEGYHALHSRSAVQDIKDFLSNVSRAYGNESLFIHTEPIAYSSGNDKRQLKHLKQSQERNTFTSWTRKPLEGAMGAICLLGFFVTWTDTWVGRTEEFKKSQLHMWAAALWWIRGRRGKRLIIYDSNSDLLPEGEIFEKDLILGNQRSLTQHLREKEEYNISEIWVGAWRKR